MEPALNIFPDIKVACAGWTVAKEHAALFPAEGSHLERYARLFPAVEINSTFYRLPKAETVVKWKDAVPPDFRFAVKLARDITHYGRLARLESLPVFLERMSLLEEKHGPLLVQLPPSLVFDTEKVMLFFETLRSMFPGQVAVEPRHPSWFKEGVEEMLAPFQLTRVAAEPPMAYLGDVPGWWDGLDYYRLHGSPRMFYSSYETEYLKALQEQLILAAASKPVWCVFNNTASGAAVENGLWMLKRLKGKDAQVK